MGSTSRLRVVPANAVTNGSVTLGAGYEVTERTPGRTFPFTC